MRLFIAAPLPEPIVATLERCQQRLIKAVPQGLSLTKPTQLHLTFLFLGDKSESDLPALIKGLDEVTADIQTFEIRLTKLSAFPSRDDPRVVWSGVSDSDGQLALIAGRLRQLSAELGYPVEQQEFTPHLTLARSKQVKNRIPLRLFLEREQSPEITDRIERLVLYNSIPNDGAHLHQELHSAPLRALNI
jgi:2'-5' RNA ligase